MMKYKICLIMLLFVTLVACVKEKKLTNSNPPFSFTSFHSSCKEKLGKISETGGTGKIIISSFNDTIRVVHANASYNCCAKIEMNVKKTQVGFDLFEKDHGDTCDCTCDFDVTAFIFGIKLGTYLVRVFDTSGDFIDQGYVIVQPTNDNGPRPIIHFKEN